MLSGPDGNSPVYIGREMKQNEYVKFNTGGGGYILNRPAVATLYGPLVHIMQGDHSAPDICLTQLRVYYEDVMVGACLKQVHTLLMNIVIGDYCWRLLL